ncbi:unnamed protein product [Cuscuta campestris]|uniref:Uncharacterized protein n=1 Tax=Cuscuta campestris TaxID=132261 RepID=A0A484L2B3_9ASTE|nr:unnamed protein product [Cuscuta campestris]
MAAPSDPLASLPSGVKLLLRSLHNLIPEKLTETNYPAWSLNVQTALSANLLLGWIDGHEAAPAPTISKNDKTVPNPEYTSWTIVDTQIRACLLAVISPSVHKHARGFTTSAALWDALAARYNSVSTAHVYQLRDKLHTLRKEKLTETNYPAWSLNVQTALSANLLLGWIDGHEAASAPTISKNDKTVPNPEYTSWTIVDTQICACLLAVISPSVHKHARGFTTSVALWDALAARYNSVSTAHVYQLRDKLHTLRKGTKTMTQYLDDVATILSDLDALKEEIPEPFWMADLRRNKPGDGE